MAAISTSRSIIFKRIAFYLGIPALMVGTVIVLPLTCRPGKNDLTHAALAERVHTPVVEKQFDTYKEAQAFVAAEKKHLHGKANSRVSAAFTRLLKNDLAPFWLGTPWNYNGVTQTPGEGTIACGYFVTTLLQDMGVSINRVKMAQCASSQIIRSLTGPPHIVQYNQMSFEEFIAAVFARGKGVTVTGLDFHTGLLLHDGDVLWFLHSNYINAQGVVMEPAAESAALRASKTRMCGHITDDPDFLKQWVRNELPDTSLR